MAQYSAPGVYVEEVERGGKPIEGVGTSTPGFLGETERGPETPRLLTSVADYRRLFGGAVENRYLAQAVEGFFQNGGSRCYVGRITPEVTETATANLPAYGSTAGHLRPATETLDFGVVASDQTPTRTVDLVVEEERGDETITVTDLTVTGSRSDDFTVETSIPAEGLAVRDDDPTPIEITFAHPDGTSSGADPTLEISVEGSSTADNLTLAGEASGSPVGDSGNDGVLGVTTGRLDVGSVVVGETASATVTVENLGESDIVLAGSDAIAVASGPATVDDAGSFDGLTVASEASETVGLTVAPTSEGDFSATVEVTDDNGDVIRTVEVVGSGIHTDESLAAAGGDSANDGDLATASGPLEFGTFVVGNDRRRSLELYSRGTKAITITDTAIDGAHEAFSVQDADEIADSGLSVDAGSSETITVDAHPRTDDEEQATLELTYDVANGPTGETTSVDLRATVAPSIIELVALGPGDWGAGVAVTVEDGSLYEAGENDLFRVTIRYWSDPADREAARPILADPLADIDDAPDPDLEETYDNLRTDEASGDFYGTVLSDASTLIDVVDEESQAGQRPANGTVWLDASFPDKTVAASDYEGDATVDPADRVGFAAFEQIDEITMVCIPDEHEYDQPLSGKIVTHCVNQGDRFAILQSPPSPPTPGKLQPSERSDFAAFYYPWVTVDHPETGRDQDVPPGGHIAGIYARTDQNRGVHKAPANATVRGIRGLQKKIPRGDQEILNPRGVNCIRTFRGRGTRVWGARTTSSDPAWKYVNVRRLFLFVEESIDEGTQWVVFEPNDEQLWARVRQTIKNFLTSVWQDGALMGSTPEEAFFVKCDRSTMTQNDIDNGRLICEIGIAPVKPAEFVIFRISQTTAGGEA